AEDGIRDLTVTGVQTCALPIFQPQCDSRRKMRRLHRQMGRGSARFWPAVFCLVRKRNERIVVSMVRLALWRRERVARCETGEIRSEERRVGKEGRTRRGKNA